MSISLGQLLRELHPLAVKGPVEREVSGIAFDSRRVFPGMLFVALKGRLVDGHEHVSAAIDRGACAVVCERNGFASRRATQIKVADSREALARAATLFYGRPSQSLRVTGITGTNGKTTVGFLLRHLLEAAGDRAGLISTVRYDLGDRTIPAQRSTPEAVEVQSMLSQMVRSGCRQCVLEVSSHALDQKRVVGVEFDTAVFTNLTRDHLDYHGSPEDYYRTKRRLFEEMLHSERATSAVIDVDTVWGERLHREVRLARQVTCGLEGGGDLRASAVRLEWGCSVFQMETPWGGVEVRLPLVGRFNVSNALAAAGVALIQGFSLEQVQAALAVMPQVPGRLEQIDEGQPFAVVVDYAHTEDALSHVLEALREVTSGRLIVVFGCGGERDPAKRGAMGRVAGTLAQEVIVTNDNPRCESPRQIADEIEEGLRRASGASWVVEFDRARAIEEAVELAAPGDTVLVAGKGHESYQEFEGTVVPFDDRQQVREALEFRGWRGGGTRMSGRRGH